ncbi:MAG TPA: hypothetical protein VN363_10160, partial [Anaerolineales bacterium]|nr:hypothetical protein [Anaerolineales bacterium]
MPNRRQSIPRILILLAGVCLAAWLSACTATPPPLSPGDWLVEDLLALDPPENRLANDPLTRADLIAAYARPTLDAIHLRVDLLDFPSGQDADLYIAIDSGSRGTNILPLAGTSELSWEVLLVIPAIGELQVLDSDLNPIPDSALRVARSPGSHSIALAFNPASLPGAAPSLRLEFFTALPGSQEIADRLGPQTPQTAIPQAMPALLAFWDSFPAATPAQALRRWDGAHTGPLGGRHGLFNLLRTARAREIPLVLLDLGSPETLAALEYAGGMGLTAELALSRQLILPASLPGLLAQAGEVLPLVDAELLAAWLEASRESQLAYGLPASPFVSAPLSAAQFSGLEASLQTSAGRTIFTFRAGSSGPFGYAARRGQQRLLILPQLPAGSTPDRLDFALEARRELAQAAWDWNAAETDPGQFLTLGGSLPESPFGSPAYARLAFQYLQEHPWIRLLSEHDLRTLPASRHPLAVTSSPIPPPTSDLQAQAVQAAPEAALELPQPAVIALPVSRWGADFLRAIYTQPYPAPPGLASLRAGYLGMLSSLAEAEAWLNNPTPRLECSGDPDQEGAAECILADESFYAQIELDDGRLELGIARRDGSAREAGGAHLLIAPGYLLVSGLGDPAGWNLAAGERADPQVLAGGFGGGEGPYTVEILADGLRLSSPDGTTIKEYRLENGGLAFHIAGAPGSLWQLPLVIEPQQRQMPGWWKESAFM